MFDYLVSLQQQLEAAEIGCQVLLMTSGGGLTTLQSAAEFPIRLVESGPAGGAMLAAHMANTLDLASVLSFDMGGTTAKICLIDDGKPLHSRSFEVDRSYRFKKGSGLPVRIPVIEMVEIGAGGGSIAQVDELKRLLVGPDSAGSEPGPACYGRGGKEATVTDADVLLGKVEVDTFADGYIDLQLEDCARALKTRVATPLGVEDDQAAHLIAQIVEENMAAAARAHASEWGKDLSQRSMIAFGGAAPLHAVALARKLKMKEVYIPAGAGVGSALGFLLAPISYAVVRSLYLKLQDVTEEIVTPLFSSMYDEAVAVLRAAGAQSFQQSKTAYMRYVGQGYEIAVEVDDDLSIQTLHERFEIAYQTLYGRRIPGMQIEILSWTLSLSANLDADAGSKAANQVNQIENAATVAGRDAGASTLGGQDAPSQGLFDGKEWQQAAILKREALSQENITWVRRWWLNRKPPRWLKLACN